MSSPESHNITSTVPFLLVQDMEVSLQFYRDSLGFTIQDSWTPDDSIEWCQIVRDLGTLMLQKSPTAVPGGSGGISIYFICNDALSIYQEITQKGIQTREPFVGNHMWVVTVIDPDGHEINFESKTTVPEDTHYSDWKSQ